jgi:hypothetical protein
MEGPLGAVRRLVDADTGEPVPYAPYAFSGRHTQVDKRVGMSTDAVGKINRKLAKHRILVIRGRIGNYNFYRISPYIAFHGTGIEQREAVKTCNPPDIPGFDDNVPARWEVQ